LSSASWGISSVRIPLTKSAILSVNMFVLLVKPVCGVPAPGRELPGRKRGVTGYPGYSCRFIVPPDGASVKVVKFRAILPIFSSGAGASPGPPDEERVRMMTRMRRIGLTLITAVAAVVASLCLPAGPVSAAGGEPVLSAKEWFDRGRFMGEIGNYHRAVEAFSRVIELSPDSARAHNNRGLAHSELGNYRLAIQDFNRAVTLNPNEASFRFNRGIAFGKGEEFELAIRDFKRVIEMDPRHTDARFFLGLLQRSTPGEGHTGTDNIKVSAQMGNKDAQEYLRIRFMGWY